MFTCAITRRPGPNFAAGVTTAGLGAPDYDLALAQHAAYVRALESLGVEVTVLDPLPDYPDGCFVEDVAVVTREIAVITRPGAASRQGEEKFIEPVLAQFRPIVRIQPPGTLEGGDVLIVDKQVFIGLSDRTNASGAGQLGHILEGYGYSWQTIAVEAGLHLKSDLNYLGQNTLLATHRLAGLPELASYPRLTVEREEAYAANTLWVNGTLITPAGFPRVSRALEKSGLPVITLVVSEFQKMDGGLTCLSLRF